MIIKVAVPQQFKLRVIPDIKSLIFGSGREIHYIGGTEVLPPPLEGAHEKEMIRELGTERAEEAKKTLIEHNLRLVVYIAKKFDNTGVGVEDLISIGTIGLIKAINTFNPTKKIKLATYASRCIENEILMYFRAQRKLQGEVSLSDSLDADGEGGSLSILDTLAVEDDMLENLDTRDACQKVRGCVARCLDEREATVISLRYGLSGAKPLTQREVAVRCGISRSYSAEIIEQKSIKSTLPDRLDLL